MRFFKKNRPLFEKIIITLGLALLSLFVIFIAYMFFSLDIAIVSDDLAQVKLLLKMGYAVNPKDQQSLRFSPLYLAVVNNKKEISEILIAHGADINIKDESGRTLLEIALILNRKEGAKLLIEKGAQINESTLDWAAYHGNKEIVELLVKKGLNVNAPCPKCPSPFHTAIRHDHVEVVDFFITRGAIINPSEKGNFTPLHHAASTRANKSAKLLISKGSKINTKDMDGHTPLYYATKNEDITMQQMLITAGAIRE